MGCRCCKIIQSYILDPEDIQSPRYINEVNNYKPDKQDNSKLKGHQNSETQVHKNDLQDDELKRTENKNRLNSTKEAFRDNRRSDLHEDDLGNHVEKSDNAINGVNSCSGMHLIPNPNTNRIEETTIHGNSSQSASSSLANSTRDLYTSELSQPNESGKESDPEEGDYKKPASEEPESSLDEKSQSGGKNLSLTESTILETQNNAIQPDLQHGSQTRNSNTFEKDNFSDNYTHSDQNAESIVINKDHDLNLPLHMKEHCDSLDRALKTEFVNVCVKEDMPDGIASEGLIRGAQEAKHITHKEINGKIEEEEEEDAEVAEALAALEAATAGEDYEEDYEY
uniref:Chromosome 4 open reading frame 19 n=1 Tax=Pelusios castaneus TaxID=367368 RepID=A0A8C8S0A8_9SAUR